MVSYIHVHVAVHMCSITNRGGVWMHMNDLIVNEDSCSSKCYSGSIKHRDVLCAHIITVSPFLCVLMH